MAKTKVFKWIGGALGWVLGGGPLGAMFGFAVGAMFDNVDSQAPRIEKREAFRHQTQPGDFSFSLLVLSAAVMKADEKVLKSELNFVKQFLVQQYGEGGATQMLLVLKRILDQPIPLKEVCEQVRYNMEYPMRLQMLHYLFGISRADGRVDQSEVWVIEQISGFLGLNPRDFLSIKAMFVKDSLSAYKILEIEKSASDTELKKAYRKMAIKFHPDKVASLGPEHQKAAKEKFQKVQQAYDQIKKERGIN